MSALTRRPAATLFLCLLLCACGKRAPETTPDDSAPVTLMPQYSIGFDFEKLRDAEHLQGAPVREAATSGPDHRDLVYFGVEGDLHVSLKSDASGREVLNATPFIVPSALTVEERLARWDRGTEQAGHRGK
jgi:hypothetical protein